MKLIEPKVELNGQINWLCRVGAKKVLNVRMGDVKRVSDLIEKCNSSLKFTKLENEYGWCRHSINVCWIECNKNDKRGITNAFFKTSLHALKDVFDILSTFLVISWVPGMYDDRVPCTVMLWISGCSQNPCWPPTILILIEGEKEI